jgi:hypothetical protein
VSLPCGHIKGFDVASKPTFFKVRVSDGQLIYTSNDVYTALRAFRGKLTFAKAMMHPHRQ